MPSENSNLHFTRRTLLALAAGTGLAPLAARAQAAEYPDKLIRLVVPAPPGGGTDVMARLISGAMASFLKWNVVAENVPGAGGNIGLDRVAKAASDGHTLAMGESSNLTVNQTLYKKLPFAVDKDLAPVSLVARVPLVLVVSGKGPYASVADLAKASRSKPVTFASSGNGTLGHLGGELWKKKAGLDLVHVPYRGAGPAMTDLGGGQVDMFFASITAALPLVQSGVLRALAVASAARSPIMPDVPTMKEANKLDIEATVLFGLVATGGTPVAVISKLNREVNRILQQPTVRKALLDLGALPDSLGGSVGSFETLLKAERIKWGQVVRDAGATVD